MENHGLIFVMVIEWQWRSIDRFIEFVGVKGICQTEIVRNCPDDSPAMSAKTGGLYRNSQSCKVHPNSISYSPFPEPVFSQPRNSIPHECESRYIRASTLQMQSNSWLKILSICGLILVCVRSIDFAIYSRIVVMKRRKTWRSFYPT